jgi:riboflavin transporter FmnP
LIEKYVAYAREQFAVVASQGPKAAFQKLRIDNEDGNINLVLGFIVTAIVMAMGVIILANVESAVPLLDENSSWSALQQSVATTTQSGYGLLAIVLIIMAAAGILGVLFMFSPRQK